MKITIEAESIEELIGLLRRLEEDQVASAERKERIATAKGKSIDELCLTVRTHNCLKSQGIETVQQLVSWSRPDLMRIPNMGRRSVDEVMVVLSGAGLKLAEILEAKRLHEEVPT